MINGIPSILVDPKFDTQKRLIESIPEEYLKYVDFLDLGDMIYPPAFNIFRRRNNSTIENMLITQSFISCIKKQFSKREWSYKIQRMFQISSESILTTKDATISELFWILSDKDYRGYVIEIIKRSLETNPENKSQLKKLLKYWIDYDKLSPQIQTREAEPVLNKLSLFLSNRFINAIVSQRESYDFRKSGDIGKTTIINLPEGIINSDNMLLLSNFINKSIWLDYQSRDELDMNKRYPVKWIIDEAHTVVDEDFINILTKSRSRRIGITLISQALSNFDNRNYKMSQVISDNCKNKFLFRLGFFDAKSICEDFAPLKASDIANCKDHHYYGKIILPDGSISNPFYAKCLSPAKVLRNYDEYIKKHHSGRLKINEIEDNIDNRLTKIKVINKLKNI